MKEVPQPAEESCHPAVRCGSVRVQFSVSQPITMVGGSALLFRLLERLGLRRALTEALPHKAQWARYTRADEVLALLTSYAVGLQRVAHVADTGPDPLLPVGLALERFPHVATLYRALGRFDSEAQVEALQRPHQDVIAWLLRGRKQVILDVDGTVETVFASKREPASAITRATRGGPATFR